MEQPSRFLRPRDVAKVSLSLVLPAPAPVSGAPVDPPEAPADRQFAAPVRKTCQLVPVVDPLAALVDQWERQAQGLDELNAAVPGGTLTASLTARVLRENAAELRATLNPQGGCRP